MKKVLMDELQRTFRQEFLNRIDDIIVFNRLSRIHLNEIFQLQLNQVHKLLADTGIEMRVVGSAQDIVLRDGYQEELWARPMRRAIQRLIQNPLALKILNGEFSRGDSVLVEVDTDSPHLCFSKVHKIAA